jgi:hypothetical protein
MASYDRPHRLGDRDDPIRGNRMRMQAASPGRSNGRAPRDPDGLDRGRRDAGARAYAYDDGRAGTRRPPRGRPDASPPSSSRGGPPPARRPQRPTYDDDYARRGSRDAGRSAGGGRPGSRDASYPPSRGRGASPDNRGAPGGRGRPPARDDFWDDEPPRRRRPEMGDPRGRPPAPRPSARDPRSLSYLDDDDESESGGMGKSLAIIVLMFLLGAGAAFGYFKLSMPHVSSNSTAPSSTTPSASPASSPATTPSPHALAPLGGGYTVLRLGPPAL